METASSLLSSETCHISNNPKENSYKNASVWKNLTSLGVIDLLLKEKIPQGLEGSKACPSEKSQKSGEVGDNIGK